MGRPLLNLTGLTFGRLTVCCVVNEGTKLVAWKCQCICGSILELNGARLTSGSVKSCGCYNKSCLQKRAKHGHLSNGQRSEEYNIWAGIKQRCLNSNYPAYSDYGGRGITIHPDWIENYKSFIDYMGRRPSKEHSIDRIDNNGNYEPGNVRWGTEEQQGYNKRNTQFLTIGPIRDTLNNWSKVAGISSRQIHLRLWRGWSPEDSILKSAYSRNKTYLWKGKMRKFKEICKMENVESESRCYGRLGLGWSIEDAITKPYQTQGRH